MPENDRDARDANEYLAFRKGILDLCDEIEGNNAKRHEGSDSVYSNVLEIHVEAMRHLLTRTPVKVCPKCQGTRVIMGTSGKLEEYGKKFACPTCTVVCNLDVPGNTPQIETLNTIARGMDWPQLWYENKDGEKWIPDFDNGMPEPPEGFKYQVSSFACQLEETYLAIEDGNSKEIANGHSGYWKEVVEAMVRAGFPLDQSILIQANACARCVNVLAWEFGVGGYALYSINWHKCGTTCRICKGLGIPCKTIDRKKLPHQPAHVMAEVLGDEVDMPETAGNMPPEACDPA